MTIIGLFRRYRRWNPVHPSYGAFWGFGIGVGCGVGWGPGFGPEAVGFVGGGCGVGFSVGVTLVGFGIGLPADGLASLPFNVLSCATSETFNLAKCATPLLMNTTVQGFRSISEQAVLLERNLTQVLMSMQSSKQVMSMDAHLRKSMTAFETSVKEGKLKLRSMSSQALQILIMKGSSGSGAI